MKHTRACIVLGLAALVGAVQASAPTPGDAKGEEVTLGGLKSRVPSAWKTEAPSNKLRVYQFRVPKAEGDKEDAELVVFFFGEGSGGDTDANLKRWKTQFQPPKGKTIDEVSRVEKYKVGKVDVVCLDVQGTYLSKFPPNDPNAKVVPKADYRRFNAVFDTDKGAYFITFTGPAKTMEKNKAGFDNWVKAFK